MEAGVSSLTPQCYIALFWCKNNCFLVSVMLYYILCLYASPEAIGFAALILTDLLSSNLLL